MRPLVMLTVAALPILGAISNRSDRTAHSPQDAPTAAGLILQKSEGEHRVRRPRPTNAGQVAAAALTIKVDQRNGGSSNFFMASEDILPGDAIAPHLHPEYDEILFVHRGAGVATLGTREAAVTEGATIYVPPNTRVSLKNTSTAPLSIIFVFPHPQMVSAYYRELSVPQGQPAVPFSSEEFAAFRARHKGHVTFDQR
jgi:mannose-6-phosphate isomerase-like protein (cupin superfamily)